MDNMLDMIGQDRVAKGLYWTKALSLVEGCTPVSEGCAHCWSAAQTHMRKGQDNPKIKARYSGLTTDKGCFNGKVRLMDETLDLPLRTRKPTVWAVWNDFFHPSVTLDFQAEALSVMRRCPQHIFLILTKREKQLATFNYACGWSAESYPNIWLGVTVESSEYLYRIDELLKVDASVIFVSYEPALGPLVLPPDFLERGKNAWVVCGGETGHAARPMHPDWPRRVCRDCKEAGVKFFFKQWGHFTADYALLPDKSRRARSLYHNVYSGVTMEEPTPMYPVGKKQVGRLLDGRTWSELPGREA